MKNPFDENDFTSPDDQIDALKACLTVAIAHIGELIDCPEVNHDDCDPETAHIVGRASRFYNQTKNLEV